MKLALTALAAVVAATTLAPEAEARRKRYVYDSYGNYRAAERPLPYYGRPASVGPNGLCQRDTGTPTGDLNFRNRCDVEEFWNRTIQGGRRH
jgi:hypothetical protein